MSSVTQRRFAGGELAPSQYANCDLVKYAFGLRTLRNFFVLGDGGVANRPGTSFICEAKDSTKFSRMIPFQFNTDQTYILEVGDGYTRVMRYGSQVLETAKNITGITQANPGVVTSAAHGFSNGQEVYIAGVAGMTRLNTRNFKVAGATANTFTLTYMDGTPVNTTGFSAYTSGGTVARVYTISSPYVEADLREIQYVQSADIITLAHEDYEPREISRSGHTSWAYSTLSFAPSISAPTGVSNSGAAGSNTSWVVTAVKAESYEESIASTATSSSATPTSGTPITVSWATVSGAVEYNIYKRQNGIYGYIGTAQGTTFSDGGIPPDTSETPPVSRNPFATSYPSTVAYIQQRLMFGMGEYVYGSRIGMFKNFTIRSPLQEDDAVTFNMAARGVQKVRHLLDIGQLIVFTENGEHGILGGNGGAITPFEINPRQYSYNGASTLAPIVADDTAIYIQARGSIIRDLFYTYERNGYKGNDLTKYAKHLFKRYQVVAWAYQKTPNSILWCVRSDGTVAALTYVKEHEIMAWHRHDFAGGFVEDVCSVPEGSEDAVYFLIRRTINGVTKRYYERLNSRSFTDIRDAQFCDSAISFDGRNTNASHTMAITGGTEWNEDELMTITSSTSFFSATEIDNEIQFVDENGDIVFKFELLNYISGTVMTGKPDRTIPAEYRNVAVSTWNRAVDELSGFDHLEGEDISVLADGKVIANPNNATYPILTVTNGKVTLDKPYAVITGGLPITSDLETLDIDNPQGQTLKNKKMIVSRVSMQVEETRGIWGGVRLPSRDDSQTGLTELKARSNEAYDKPVDLKTEYTDLNIEPEWTNHGRICIRQTDPLPVTILAITPEGLFGG